MALAGCQGKYQYMKGCFFKWNNSSYSSLRKENNLSC